MYLYDQPHRDWAQRKFTIGVAVVAGFVVLLSVLGGPGANIWDRLLPTGVAQRIQTIGSI